MLPVILKKKMEAGHFLQATFLPEKGMNMVSFRCGDVELIDPLTKDLFEERFAGLGALIGPHFYHRKEETIPLVREESRFPHVARLRAQGVTEPFSHGIARYAPWKCEVSETSFQAVLKGSDLWNGIPLKELEGQDFTMRFSASLTDTGLRLNLSVVSDRDSVVGIHYYYRLPNGKGILKSSVQDTYVEEGSRKRFSPEWDFDSQQRLTVDLSSAAFDHTFHPFPTPLEGCIDLITDEYQLKTTYRSDSQENSWQLYHPKGASFVCVEPLSSQDPRRPNLTVSSIQIHLEPTIAE